MEAEQGRQEAQEQKRDERQKKEKIQEKTTEYKTKEAIQEMPEQKFFTVKEVSRRTGLSISTLRYYDKEGLTPQVVRNASGIRQYTGEDVCWLELICCLKHSGMALEEIRRFMELCLEGEAAAEKRREVLLKQKMLLKQQIECLSCSLELIEYKLEHYKEIGIFHFGESV